MKNTIILDEMCLILYKISINVIIFDKFKRIITQVGGQGESE